MKSFFLWDFYEDHGLIGEYDTEEEARAAAAEHNEDTDGECQIVLYKYNSRKKGYEVVA